MPNGGGRRSGTGRGAGQGQNRGAGIGRQGGRGLGPNGTCVCTACRHTVPHRLGVPCNRQKCPNCGAPMARQD